MLRLVDLSVDLYHGAPNFRMDPQMAVWQHLRIQDRGYNLSQLYFGTHQGTHVDPPKHFFDDGKTIEEIDARRVFGPAWVLDLTHKKAKEDITVADLEAFSDKIGKGSRVILHTGWDKQIDDVEVYLNDQPNLTVEACEWLAEKGIACVAMDMPTLRVVEYFEVHHALLNPKAEVAIIESLRGLDRLQGEQVILVALPLRIREGNGGPCRAMAIDGDIEPLVEMFEALEFDPND